MEKCRKVVETSLMNSLNHGDMVLPECRSSPFPEEVLEKMFENLSDPDDLLNVTNSCPQFRRILQPRLAADLFGLVLPHISIQLRADDLLECRLVCKSWKSAVHYLLHDHPSVRPYDPKNDNIKNPISPIHNDITNHFRRFFNPNELGIHGYFNIFALQKYLRNHQGNPFVYEKVTALTTKFNKPSNAWKQTFKFLKSHGKYITHFKMYCQDYKNSFVQFYKIMQRCLKLLPNLKTLHLDQNSVGDNNDQDMYREHLYHEDFFKSRLERVIDKYELPSLPKLDTLIMLIIEPCQSRYQRIILESLLWHYEGQLKKIHVSPVLWFARFVQLDELRDSLTELHIETNKSAPPLILKLLWTMKGYLTLRKLSFRFDSYTENINFQNIMEALDGIRSVQYLKFYGFGKNPIVGKNLSNGDDDRKGEKLIQLPNVKTLEIRSVLGEFVYDTILAYLPALEYLKLENFHHHGLSSKDDTEDDLGFEVFKGLKTRKMYESRIWKRLPFLKEIICSEESLFPWEVIYRWRSEHRPGDPTQYVRFTRDRYKSLMEN